MIRPDLPVIALADLPGGSEPVVLCATARLATDLRRAHGEAQAARGATTWRALQSATPALWLDHLVSRALLAGEIPPDAVAGSFLGHEQERKLWELAIARDTGAASSLFDGEGLALAAMEAASLQRHWRIEVPAALHNAEYAAFLRWRADVDTACRAGGWRGMDEILAWRIACVERGLGGLPARIGLAGFVLPDPQVSRLLLVLEQRGVELFRVDFGSGTPAQARGVACAEAEAECRAAAAWARWRLEAAGDARLRIAVAELPSRRRLLDAALADALHGDAIGAGWAVQERDYEFVGGEPLAAQPLVATALSLLQIYAEPRRIAQAEFGALLCAPGWSADIDEADARARIEAGLREKLPPEATLERLRAAVGHLAARVPAPRLLAGLDALREAVRAASRRQVPSAWGRAFGELLAALGWPGQRPLLVAEAGAADALDELIAGLSSLDAILGRIDRNEALRQLRRQCRDRAFRARRRSAPRVEVCSLDEALAGPVDGLWVIGINEGAWPPAPRPNPLLQAELQRRAGVPAARADRLADAAREIQALWCASAPEAVFSWSLQEGEKALRRSPLLDELALAMAPAPEQGSAEPAPEPMADGMPEMIDDAVLEFIEDSRAPPPGADEEIRGGTGLLAAQAACPAWAFYQYRLGAAVLPAPTFGLDALARGSLLHAALESFWAGRGLAELLAMDGASRAEEIDRVVALALADYDRAAVEPLPPRLRALEAERLGELLAVWLAVEATRSPFRVLASEERHRLDIEGLPVTVVVDRVDVLGDGRLAIIDYKSGRADRTKTWADPRITEPQLPIYAALAFPDRAVAAVALARVTREDPAFLGVAADAGLLPGVAALDGQRRRFAAADFPDWAALRALWAERIREVAREVRDGTAAVVFRNEADLQYCEVKPLLRLAERRRQMESADALSTAIVDHNPPDPRAALHSGPATAAQGSALRNPASAPLSGKGGDDIWSPSAPIGERA